MVPTDGQRLSLRICAVSVLGTYEVVSKPEYIIAQPPRKSIAFCRACGYAADANAENSNQTLTVFKPSPNLDGV